MKTLEKIAKRLSKDMLKAISRVYEDAGTLDEATDIRNTCVMFTDALRRVECAEAEGDTQMSEGYLGALVTAAEDHTREMQSLWSVALEASEKLADTTAFKAMCEIRVAYNTLERSGDRSIFTKATLQAMAKNHNRAYHAMRRTPEWDAYSLAAGAVTGRGWRSFGAACFDRRVLDQLPAGHDYEDIFLIEESMYSDAPEETVQDAVTVQMDAVVVSVENSTP